MARKEHWDKIYGGKAPVELSWFQSEPTTSLSLIRGLGLSQDARIIDIGGGASLLSSYLLDEGFRKVSVLDVSQEALAVARAQLGDRAQEIEWIETDILEFDPPHRWALWHDRAVVHFLTTREDQETYRRVLNEGIEPGGHVLIATFALDGPTKCSGLDVARHSPESLHALLGSEYQLLGNVTEAHQTPIGKTQNFVYTCFQRRQESRDTTPAG